MKQNENIFPFPHEIMLKEGVRGPIRKKRNPSLVKPDEYIIRMEEAETLIESATDAGFFYAEQSLQNLKSCGSIHDWADVPLRIVMIDLKRIGWNFNYLLSLFPLFARFRINGCLIEYEDKFPYTVSDKIAVPEAFTLEQIAELNAAAKENHIEIIPLVQAFSHWEYILKKEEFSAIREGDGIYSQACPLNPETFHLHCRMAEELVKAHPDSRFLHVGGDEARFLGHCPECAKKVSENGVESLYGDYMEQVLDHAVSLGKTPLFWADFWWKHDKPLFHQNAIAVDWNYNARSVRAASASVAGQSLGPDDTGKYAPFLAPENGTVFAFPHLLLMKKKGFRTIGAGLTGCPENVLAHSITAKELKNEAVIATYWGSGNSLTPPTSLYPMQIVGIATLGAAAWNAEYEEKHFPELPERLSNFLGDSPESVSFYQFLHRYSYSNAPIQTRQKEVYKSRTFSCFAEKLSLDAQLLTFSDKQLLFPENAFEMLELGKYVNSGYDFKVNGQKTTFTSRTLEFLSPGTAQSFGIPFALTGKLAVYGEWESLEIPRSVELKSTGTPHWNMLSAVQSLVGGDNYSAPGKCVLNYSDGTTFEIPIIPGETIGSWWCIHACGEVMAAFSNFKSSYVKDEYLLGLHLWNIRNPYPEKRFQSVEFHSPQGTVTALAAVSLLTIPEGAVCSANFNGLMEEIERVSGICSEEFKKYVSDSAIAELDPISFSCYRKFFGTLKKGVNA